MTKFALFFTFFHFFSLFFTFLGVPHDRLVGGVWTPETTVSHCTIKENAIRAGIGKTCTLGGFPGYPRFWGFPGKSVGGGVTQPFAPHKFLDRRDEQEVEDEDNLVVMPCGEGEDPITECASGKPKRRYSKF
jgi:hypothetical protein